MKIIITLFVILFSVMCNAQQPYKRTLKLMGSRFDITVVANDSLKANKYIDTAVAEITRIEKLISSWDTNSQTSEINRNAGIRPVAIDKEVFKLLERAIGLSKLTDGAFDISFASMDKIWKFDYASDTESEVFVRLDWVTQTEDSSSFLIQRVEEGDEFTEPTGNIQNYENGIDIITVQYKGNVQDEIAALGGAGSGGDQPLGGMGPPAAGRGQEGRDPRCHHRGDVPCHHLHSQLAGRLAVPGVSL